MRPVSTMSSTSTTSRPPMSTSRSWRICTRPESGAKREMAMKSTVDVDVGDGAHQVGEEDQRALQHADEHDAVGVIVGRSARPSRCDVRADRRLVEQDRSARLCAGHAARSLASESRTAWRATPCAAARPSPASSTELLVVPAPAPRGSAGGGTAAAPARTERPPVRRTCGTCGGGGPRCRAA